MNIREIRLISKFMGWTTHIRTNHWISTDVEEYDNIKLPERLSWINDGYINIKSAEFDKSWDWLMPVVEKIEKMFETESSLPRFEINSHCATFSLGFQDSPCFMAGCYKGSPEDIGFETKKEAVYYVAVEFIKWYNNSNLNENQKIGQSTII